MTTDERAAALFDLYSDIIARIRFEPLTRAQQHAQLDRIAAAVAAPAARSAPDGWELQATDKWASIINKSSQCGQDFYPDRDPLIFAFLRALAAAPASQPLMVNGLTEPETAQTASVAGLTAAQPAQAEPTDSPDFSRIAFEAWWKRHGEFIRAGGGDYEKCSAWGAWQAAIEIPCECEWKRQQGATEAPAWVALPADLIDYMHRHLSLARRALGAFLALGKEVERAAKYDRWIAALDCTEWAPARVALTDAQIERLWLTGHGGFPSPTVAFARAIERAHGIQAGTDGEKRNG